MSGASDYYFSASILSGVGKLFFLKTPQAAGPGSGPLRLIGTMVQEGHGGFLGSKEYPVPQNGHILGAVAKAVGKVLDLPESDVVNEIGLANLSTSLKLEKTASANGEAPFPGAPASLGIGVDYHKLRRVVLDFGPGARKLFIPRALLEEAFRTMAKTSTDWPTVFFDDDYMCVDQLLLVRKLTVTIESEAEFSASFEAKAAAANAQNLGVTYAQSSEKSYKLTLDGTEDYLFAVGAVEADEFVK